MIKLKSYYDYLKEEKENNYTNLVKELAILEDMYSESTNKEELNDILLAGRHIYETFFNEVLSMVKDDSRFAHNLIIQYVIQDNLVRISKHWDQRESDGYFDVRLLNSRFVEEYPNDNNKYWGGKEEDKHDCPDGFYNINWYGYQKYYAIGWSNFESFVFEDVLVEEKCFELLEHDIHKVMAHITLELTFYGINQEERHKFEDKIKSRSNNTEKFIDFEELKSKFKSFESLREE